jgi:putative transposase
MMSEWSISQRRVCRVLQLDPKSYRYKSRRPAQTVLEAKIRKICQTRIRYGVRRVHVLLRRGVDNRLQENATHLPRVRPANAIENAEAARKGGAHQTWAMDFVHDQLATG